MTGFIDRHELIECFNLVSKQLGALPMESISAAALRVFRQNCAAPVTLNVARIVLEMHGKEPPEQWAQLQRAANLIRGSAQPN